MSTTQVKHFGWALNLLESWFTSASNMMIKNLFTSENKTPVTTHTKCENPKPCIMSKFRSDFNRFVVFIHAAKDMIRSSIMKQTTMTDFFKRIATKGFSC